MGDVVRCQEYHEDEDGVQEGDRNDGFDDDTDEPSFEDDKQREEEDEEEEEEEEAGAEEEVEGNAP